MAIQPNIVQGNGGDINASGIGVAPARIYATNNSETIRSTGSDDQIYAKGGDDIIYSGHNQDVINAGDGNDFVDAGASRDFVFGGAGNDTLYGNEGNDVVVGGDDDDIIYGGDGNDGLWGDNSNGSLDGTVGADTFRFDKADGSDNVFDFAVGIDAVELTQGGTYSLTQTAAGHTKLVYGETTVLFHNALLTADDIGFI
ncbi:calcium-binding protein [Limimaricola sp. AA108-03]|uniref:calcium-binding protein n=1 Tax=Limimaricola sp. AA108-03 TaxID=3425945 RepID=UPI003D774532